jgi:hypothetical protein
MDGAAQIPTWDGEGEEVFKPSPEYATYTCVCVAIQARNGNNKRSTSIFI